MHQKIFPRRLNAKEVLITRKDGEFEFLWQMVRQNYQGETANSKNPLWDGNTPQGERISAENLTTLGKSFQPEETKDDAEARKDFWSIQGDFIYRHHIEPRVQLYVPREESFPIPLKYIDVIRSTHTDLDAAQENQLMTIGMSTETEVCQIRGRVSQDLHHWTKLLREDMCAPGGDWQKSKRHHVQITYGLTLG